MFLRRTIEFDLDHHPETLARNGRQFAVKLRRSGCFAGALSGMHELLYWTDYHPIHLWEGVLSHVKAPSRLIAKDGFFHSVQ